VEAAWYRASAVLRRRWRASLVLVALVGLAGGMVLTTVAGARRSSTAYERFRDETLAADLDVAPAGDPEEIDIDLLRQQLAALPQVEALTQTAFPFIVPARSGFYPYLDFLAIVGLDPAFGSTIDRPRLVEGRLPNPGRPDEIAVLDDYGREAGVGVDDEIDFESFAPEQLEPLFTTGDAGPPAGPNITLRVTGTFDAPSFLSESTGAFQPKVMLSPSFVGAHGDEVATYPGGFTLRLHRGPGEVAAVSDAVRDILRTLSPEQSEVELTPASEVDRKVESSIDVAVTALVLCALAAAVAGLVAVAQALDRNFSQQATDAQPMVAFGMTSRGAVLADVLTAVPVAVLGALLAVIVAVLASPLMPVGVARQAEPNPGIAVDAWALAIGLVAVLLGVIGLALAAAIAAERRARRSLTRGASRPAPSRVLGLVRTALPPEGMIGVGMVTAPRAGTAWAVRSALAGVAFGAAGLVAVVVFVSSESSLVGSSERWGSPFDAAVSGFSGDIIEEQGAELLANDDIAGLGVLTTALARVGGDEVNLHAVESLKGGVPVTLLGGRLPTASAEAVLGRSTLRDARAAVGEEVEVEGAKGVLQATVVGTASFPVIDERSAAGSGVLLPEEDLVGIADPDELNRDVLIRWADGVDRAAANEELAERTEAEVTAPRLPADVNNLQEVEALPRALAAFLALIGALAAIHALASTVRLRRRELAVLRALGFRQRQLAATLVWQATTIAAIGLVAGIPLGVAAGRLVWRAVAGNIGVVDDPVTPALAIAVVALAALAVVNLAAAVPGRVAASVGAAGLLRTG
jgi:hypothetical protein